MKLSKRRLWILGAIAIGAIALLTLLIAPTNSKINSGSTYNRSPSGYGAWYTFMSDRGTPVKRWQKPFVDLAANKNARPPVTLLRVYSGSTIETLSPVEEEWIKRGNIMVNLGVKEPVTAAPFSTEHDSKAGKVKIDTGRRGRNSENSILSDRFGAIVWEKSYGKGRVIYAITPYLAANAYQDFQGNYEFLAQIVTQFAAQGENKKTPAQVSSQIWVDEYLHGYKDREIIKRETAETLIGYLLKTPLFPVFVQAITILLVAILAGTRRFGQPAMLSTPTVDNSEAYIQALAGVLQKANSSDFVQEVLGKEEQLQLQKALLLGQVPLDDGFLLEAWTRQTGRDPAELEKLLRSSQQKRRISETDLLSWLSKWQQIRSHIPFDNRSN
ncbi:MAG TPA: DUF4350 domain-containing protein [Kamptonema sp.]|nr:DUF4350 domain-containing protein [Kamptonema sp.]